MGESGTTGRDVLRATVTARPRLVAGSTALFMSWQACESLVPVAIGAVIDNAVTPRDGAAMARWVGLFALLFLVLSMSYRFGARLGWRAGQQSAHELRVRIADRVLDPAAIPDPQHRTGTTVSVAGTDVDRVGLFCLAVPSTAGALVSVAVAAVVVLTISVPIGLLVLLGCPGLLLLLRVLGRPLERRSAVEQEHAADAAALATDLVTGLRVLIGFGGTRVAATRYAAASRRSLAATLRAARAEAGYDAVTLLLTLLFLAVIALVGGRLAASGEIAVGELVAAVGVAQFLLGPLRTLSDTGAVLAKARASAGRVAAVLRTAHYAEPDAVVPAPDRGAVHLRPLDLDVAPGALVGIAADPASAQGLVAALATARGSDVVTVDGTDLRAVDPAADVLLVARHDAGVFAESLLDNVRAGRPDGPAVRRAMAAADADEVARALPDGADTVLGERGGTLSGGQRQRVTLARALAADPLVLVLHDPTTAVDTVTESRIASGLHELRAGRTTVLVATSPALLARCDHVVHVRDGVAIGTGTHAALVAADPDYRELVLA